MKRLPTLKTLAQVFSEPARARDVLEMTHAELARTNAGAARIAEGLHAPPAWHDVRMTVLNALESNLFGIESAETTRGEYLDYLNAGDCYNVTLCYWRGCYIVACVADIVERHGVTFK